MAKEALAELAYVGDVLDEKDASDPFFSRFGGEPVPPPPPPPPPNI